MGHPFKDDFGSKLCAQKAAQITLYKGENYTGILDNGYFGQLISTNMQKR